MPCENCCDCSKGNCKNNREDCRHALLNDMMMEKYSLLHRCFDNVFNVSRKKTVLDDEVEYSDNTINYDSTGITFLIRYCVGGLGEIAK